MHQPQQDVGAPFVAPAAAGSRPATPATAPPRPGDSPSAGWTQCHAGRSAGDPASTQRSTAAQIVVTLSPCSLAGRLRGRPGRPRGPLTGGTASSVAPAAPNHGCWPPAGRPPAGYRGGRSAGGTWTLACRGLSDSGRLARPPLGAHAHAVQAGPRALLRLVSARQLTPCSHPGSDRQGELVERDRHPLVHRLLDREFVVPASQVLYEAMGGDHDPGAAILLARRVQIFRQGP
jgi:hypothetical protein